MNGRWKLDSFSNHLSAHAELTAEDRAAIQNLPFKLKTFRHSRCIVHEGESAQYCAVLVAGLAFRQKLSGTGISQIVAFKVPGEMLALQSMFVDQIDYSIFSLTDVEVAFVDRKQLVKLIQTNSRISYATHVSMAVETSILGEWILNVTRRNGHARIAHFLCEWTIRTTPNHLDLDQDRFFPFTQEQIGNAVGLTAVHVNRILRQLEDEGLIRRNRRYIALPNWRALREVGDLDERYLHRQRAPAHSHELANLMTGDDHAMVNVS